MEEKLKELIEKIKVLENEVDEFYTENRTFISRAEIINNIKEAAKYLVHARVELDLAKDKIEDE